MKAEFLYNPDGNFNHSHAATIVEHKNTIYSSWYCYYEKEHEQGQITLSKFDKEANDWTKGQLIFPSLEGRSCGNPVLFSHKGELHIFFVILKHYWDSAQIYYSKLDEENDQWLEPKIVKTAEGIMVRHRPLELDNGSLIISAYDEKDMRTILFEIESDYCTWEEYSKIEGKYIQGDLIKTNKLEWQMYLRASGDNEYVIKALTSNSGKEWSFIRPTKMRCPLSGIAAIKLNSNKILVCTNHTEAHKRTPLSLFYSESKGVHFDFGPWDIESTDIELSYPSLLQDSKGDIHLIFTYNRKKIKHFLFSENELEINARKSE